jgi:hypothetical protein
VLTYDGLYHCKAVEFNVAGSVALAKVEGDKDLRCHNRIVGAEEVNGLLADEADVLKILEQSQVQTIRMMSCCMQRDWTWRYWRGEC